MDESSTKLQDSDVRVAPSAVAEQIERRLEHHLGSFVVLQHDFLDRFTFLS